MPPPALRAFVSVVLACVAVVSLRGCLQQRQGAPARVVLDESSKDDLSLFANSAPSYYMPGDTATDSDILPKEVLADDGSQSDRAAAAQPSVQPDFSSAHWYTAGQTKDLHGDLEQENRRREVAERKMEEQREAHVRVQREREMREMANRERLREAAREEALTKAHRVRRKHILEQRAALIKAEEASKPRTSWAYRHPFAAEKKGYQNLVMSEFKKDEESEKQTTDAIFGKAKKHHHVVDFRTADEAEPMTLHQDMKLEKERKLAVLKAKAQLAQSSGKKPGRPAAPTSTSTHSRRKYVVHCTIEMLENGGCSNKTKKETSKQIGESQSARQERLRRELDGKNWRKSDGGHHWRGRLTASNSPPSVASVVGGWGNDISSLF